jgi:pantothenate kinase
MNVSIDIVFDEIYIIKYNRYPNLMLVLNYQFSHIYAKLFVIQKSTNKKIIKNRNLTLDDFEYQLISHNKAFFWHC